jgi:hypothetical protein
MVSYIDTIGSQRLTKLRWENEALLDNISLIASFFFSFGCFLIHTQGGINLE